MFRIARAIIFLVTVVGIVNLLVPTSHVVAQSPSLPTSLPSLSVPTNGSTALGVTVDTENSRLYATDSQSIWMFNTIDNKLLKTNDVTGQTESGVGKLVVNPGTHNLYASVSAGLPPSGHLIIIDSTTNTATDKKISGLSGGVIGDIQLNPKNNRIYLSSSPIFDGFNDTVLTPSRIDVADDISMKVVKSIDFDKDVIGSIAVNSKAGTIYTTNIAEAGTYTSKIWPVNETSFAVGKPQQINMAVFAMRYSEKADKVYVIGIKEDKSLWMQALNASLVPEPEVLVAKTSEPYTYIRIDMELNPLIDRMYVSNGKEFFVVDTAHNTVLGSLDIIAGNIAVDTLTSKIYVPKGDTNEIAVFQDLLPDSDGDGLPDLWETRGVTVNPGGGLPPQFIDLPKMGATPDKPDIFVQADWMQGIDNMRPSEEALRIVHDAFAHAPRPINLHIDNGPDSIMIYETTNNPDILWGKYSKVEPRPFKATLGKLKVDLQCNVKNEYDWDDFNTNYKNKYFVPTGRFHVFHYALFASVLGQQNLNGLCSPSGISNTSASDFIVSLGSFDALIKKFKLSKTRVQAGTFMHELGHNLGLNHGGGDDIRFKPNYLSVMNYAFQFTGLTKQGNSGVYDYSHHKLPTLHEDRLSEPQGLKGDTDGSDSKDFGTVHYCPLTSDDILVRDLYIPVYPVNDPIDWNCSKKIETNVVTYHIIGYQGGCPAAESRCLTLEGYDDWGNIKLKEGSIGQAGAPIFISTSSSDELTLEMALKIPPIEWVQEQRVVAAQTATAAVIAANVEPTSANNVTAVASTTGVTVPPTSMQAVDTTIPLSTVPDSTGQSGASQSAQDNSDILRVGMGLAAMVALIIALAWFRWRKSD